MGDKRLEKELAEYILSDKAPFHMPGHKRNIELIDNEMSDFFSSAFKYDITEVYGMDDLHDAAGILKNEMDEAAKFYNTNATIFSVNGSTASNLAAVFAMTNDGDKALIPSNVHRSIMHAASLRKLDVIELEREGGYDLLRDGGPVCVEALEDALKKNTDVKLVVVTSPTYDGVVSDIKTISDIAKRYGALLLVDEAHGAHFSMNDYFPESSISQGADVVVQSLHKTLPSLTQTSLLHSASGEVSAEKLHEMMDIFESSSPSYLLMASITSCLHFLKERGDEAFKKYAKELRSLRDDLSKSKKAKLYVPSACFDPGKLVVMTKDGCDGNDFAKSLREDFGIESELAKADYVLLMTSVADKKECYEKLRLALL